MTRSARNALVATLIAFHAAVAVCGAGLHALPGFGHDSGLHPLAGNDHSHGPGKSAHDAADDCPVCQFLAQGQLSCDLSGDLTAWLTVRLVTPATDDPDLAPPRRPSVPRGPPRASRPA